MKSNHCTGSRRIGGFTLIEVMIAVVVVSILMAIAIPSYRDYLRRGDVEDATSTMASGQVAIEQFFLDNRTYAGVNAKPPCPADTKNFTITCEGDASTYTITATGAGTVAGFKYTLNQAGVRTSDGPWGTGNCWIARKGDSC